MVFHSRCGAFRSANLAEAFADVYDTLFGSGMAEHTNAACPTVEDVFAHQIAVLCMSTDLNDHIRIMQYFFLQVCSQACTWVTCFG